jgi:2,4-dienoyl-CoA reductase-like NADH-dependent reductase (Old Yellow Enzyme family)
MLLARIDAHLKSTRMPPARFGREAVGDPNFVFDLRDGREPRARTITRVLNYLDQAGSARPT